MRRSIPEAVETVRRPLWSDDELERLEGEFADGLSTQQVVARFSARGEPLTEATFRKYVQLGLLPRSVRVGRKGKHRGSQGLYPATVVRQIEFVRRLMGQGYTIQQIQLEFTLGGDIDALARQLKSAIESVERAVALREPADHPDEVIARAVAEARELSDELVERLRAIERRLAVRARMARAAV